MLFEFFCLSLFVISISNCLTFSKYSKFAKNKMNGYLLTCSGYGHKLALRLLNKFCRYKLTAFVVDSFKKKELLALRNYIECEAHRELFVEGLKNV